MAKGDETLAESKIDLIDGAFRGAFDEFLENSAAILVLDNDASIGKKEIEEFRLRIFVQMLADALEDVVGGWVSDEIGETREKSGNNECPLLKWAISELCLKRPTSRAIHRHCDVIGAGVGSVGDVGTVAELAEVSMRETLTGYCFPEVGGDQMDLVREVEIWSGL
jgi:hypothetical protein